MSPSQDSSALSRPSVSSSSKPSLRILFVEDHEPTRKAMVRLLTYRGFVVVDAGSVEEAKRAVKDQDHFNLLISDIGLPDGTGLELMEWLRTATPGLPGIALTAYNSEYVVEKTSDVGFVAHLTKPLSFDVLLRAVERFASPVQH